MIMNPELQNDFSLVKGIYAVYFSGFVLLVTALTIFFVAFNWKIQETFIFSVVMNFFRRLIRY